jgi:hypothetical protein
MALKTGQEKLQRLKCFEEQARTAGSMIEQSERKIERWLASWDM